MADPEKYIKQFIDKLSTSLLDDLKSEIPRQLAKMIEKRFEGFYKALEPLSRIENEHRQQGKDIENLQISYKKMEIDIQALLENYRKLPKKLEDKVDSSMESGQENLLDAVSSQLEQTPKAYIKPKKKKRFGIF